MNTDDTKSPGGETPADRSPMTWFTSGIDSTQDAGLAAGGVARVLGDSVSLPYMSIYFSDRQIALDCGSYRRYQEQKRRKRKAPITEQDARQYAAMHPGRKFAFRIAMDVIGDAATTMLFWNNIFHNADYPHGQPFVPVYTWGAPHEHLQQYLEQAPYIPALGTNLVCLGGLAPILRGGHRVTDAEEKAKKEDARKAALKGVLHLCERYPKRFHILGLNHLDAIDQLRHLLASADASKWLDGRRYGYVFFYDSRTHKLRYAPSGALTSPALKQFADYTTNQRLTHNAKIIAHWAETPRIN
ncbi:MAG: hypothetical protein U0X20_16985 [Caldilineaceae bacterium]